ncbi:MAG: phytoene desaturase family protein [Candidatus Helarchaeota archaeon]
MCAYDAIVIGAGTSGLSIAALLANAGGGRARTIVKNGFIVDYGIHSLRGNYQQVFHSLNMDVHRKRMPITKGIILEHQGILHKLPRFNSLFRSRALRIGDISLLIRHLGRVVLCKPNRFFNVSIQQWLNQIGASQRVTQLFQLLSLTLLVCPFLERASLGELLLNLRHLNLTGLGHPHGGFRTIHQSLLWKLKKCGGELQTQRKVDEIIIEKNQAVGVRVNEKEIRADIVVSSLPVQQLHKILNDSLLDESFRTFIRNLRPTAGISIDYGLSEKISNELMFIIPDPAILGSFTSNIDRSVAPEKKQLMTFLNVLNIEDVRYRAKAKAKQKQLEEKILDMFPKIEDAIEWKRTLILEMVDGVELNTHQTQDYRPDVQVPNIKNLFIASDSTCATGAGGDIAFSSAKLCFERILKLRRASL